MAGVLQIVLGRFNMEYRCAFLIMTDLGRSDAFGFVIMLALTVCYHPVALLACSRLALSSDFAHKLQTRAGCSCGTLVIAS
jgi:hypothetical protein